MRRRPHVRYAALTLLCGCLLSQALLGQARAPPDALYQQQRTHAAELFRQGQRMQALPLLEQLVSAHPRDDEMLVALAACLLEHAATVSDQGAAGKERLRARDLLDRARSLGNRSPLALNLSELLASLPRNGAFRFSDNAAADEAMHAGEAAFSRGDFAAAIASYSRALALDPRNYTAALFIGNSYDREGRFEDGATWYERAMRLDPDIETAYRYDADMQARRGDMAAARALLMQAAVAEPYNRIVWRELTAWATLNGTHIHEVFVAVPAPRGEQPPGFREPPQIAAVWQAYRDVRSRWHRNGQPDRHGLAQEAAALSAAAQVAQRLSRDPGMAGLVKSDPSVRLLLSLYEAGLIEPYVLFSLGDRGIAQDYAPYRARHRGQLTAYLDRFVVPQRRRGASVRP